MTREQLFKNIEDYFFNEEKLAYCDIFATKTRNVEGWFKGELFHLFTLLENQGLSPDWKYEFDPRSPDDRKQLVDPEASDGKKRLVDFMIVLDQEPLYLEVKTAYLGMQVGQEVYPSTYLSKTYSIGPDVRKLQSFGQGYCLVFVYPFPVKPELWHRAMQKFITEKMPPVIVSEENSLEVARYDRRLHIARLRVAPPLSNSVLTD